MTTLDSSSGVESSMDDNSLDHQNTITTHCLNGDGIADQDDVLEDGDREIWKTISKSFRQVQTFLDQNRILIQQVNENHQSKLPDNLTKNVALIREINGNISKVVSLYSDLSTNFSSFFHQRRVIKNKVESEEETTDPSISDDECGISIFMFNPQT
ncbi:Protein of unknown function DUF1313 [Macleaya cordata]|uniref:Protein EARLY FLOWERING 4 domain-containing protein n=1 Tax=Macleaya cordata TaxID=56857 RepID=A0A200PWW9_MACCD|nr:Protein of unknown function DUF1313 [Macleaya cordata]